MLRINSDGQNILFAVVTLSWLVGMIALFFRFRAKQRTYLRRFPPVEGAPLEMAWPFLSPMRVTREVIRLLSQRQPDPELERLRRKIWRSYRDIFFWVFGFLVLVAGVLALLILTGLVTFTS
jgi:hypothetical protein